MTRRITLALTVLVGVVAMTPVVPHTDAAKVFAARKVG